MRQQTMAKQNIDNKAYLNSMLNKVCPFAFATETGYSCNNIEKDRDIRYGRLRYRLQEIDPK